jgi:dipeptidase E
MKIAQALYDLVSKSVAETRIAFIPTAAFYEEGNKDWLIDDLYCIKELGYYVDIVEISALTKEQWLPRLESSDVLFFGGGNTYYLMHWLLNSGLNKLMNNLLKYKVYVGISAGSMVASPTLSRSDSERVYSEHFDSDNDVQGLGLVPFYVIPHLNSPHFPNVRKRSLQVMFKSSSEKIYALDDQSALKIVDREVEIVSEGQWLEFN